jgi:hypothetical protein
MELIYKGKTRPLYYVTNFGNVFLNDGDVLRIEKNRTNFLVYKQDVFNYGSYHRHFAYLSNLLPHRLHGLIVDLDKQIDLFKSILSGESLTELEYDNQCINKIAESLPKSNLAISHYQFSNDFRPINQYTYKDGKYNGSNIDNGTAKNLAWYIYRNLYKVIPYNTEEISATEWEQIPKLY